MLKFGNKLASAKPGRCSACCPDSCCITPQAKSRIGEMELQERFDLFAAGEWHELLERARLNTQGLGARRPAQTEDEELLKKRKAERATTKVKVGMHNRLSL